VFLKVRVLCFAQVWDGNLFKLVTMVRRLTLSQATDEPGAFSQATLDDSASLSGSDAEEDENHVMASQATMAWQSSQPLSQSVPLSQPPSQSAGEDFGHEDAGNGDAAVLKRNSKRNKKTSLLSSVVEEVSSSSAKRQRTVSIDKMDAIFAWWKKEPVKRGSWMYQIKVGGFSFAQDDPNASDLVLTEKLSLLPGSKIGFTFELNGKPIEFNGKPAESNFITELKHSADEIDIDVVAESNESDPEIRARITVDDVDAAMLSIREEGQENHESSQTPLPPSPKISDMVVCFSCFAPNNASEQVFTVDIFVHRETERDSIISSPETDDRTCIYTKRGVCIEEGSTISATVESCSDALRIESGMDEAIWNGQTANISFMFSSQNQRKPQFAKVKFSIDGIARGMLMLPLRKFGAENEAKISCRLWRFPPGKPHVFLSYRRTHSSLADRIKLRLQHKFGYEVFMDTDPDCGLKSGDFQRQLEEKLSQAQIFVPLLTPAPSGNDPLRRTLTYLGSVKAAAQSRANDPDWCLRELELALKGLDANTKVIIPVYQNVNLNEEFSNLPSRIAPLKNMQAIELIESYFQDGIRRIHEGIQHFLLS